MNWQKSSTDAKDLKEKISTSEAPLENSESVMDALNLGMKKDINEKGDFSKISSEEIKMLNNDKHSESKKENPSFEFYLHHTNSYKKIEHLKDMSKRKLNELTEAFNLIDFDRDGIINSDDLKKTFLSLNHKDITHEEIEQMLTETSKPLDFDSFVVLLGCKTLDLDPIEVLLDAFSFWDEERNGYIPHDRILEDIVTLGDKFTEAEAKAALADAPFFFSKAKKKMIEYLQFSEDICGLRKMLQRRNTKKIQKPIK